MYDSEHILPYNDKESKTEQVKTMFDHIAPGYDRYNHIASFGIDKFWRKKGILALKQYAPQEILDVATGTGDYAISAYKLLHPRKITGIDLSEGMMQLGRKKIKELSLEDKITFLQEDSTQMTFADATFDAVTVAFGVRNFENIREGYREMFRVLKPGGHLSVLEFTTPRHFPMKQLYRLYSAMVMPILGKFINKDVQAYEYLPESISVVPQFSEMTQILDQSGFIHAEYRAMTFGICTLYLAQKPI